MTCFFDGKHAHHNVSRRESVSAKKKSEFEGVISNCKLLNAETNRVESFIQSEIKLLTENRDSTKAKISSKYQALHKQLDDEERKLQDQVDAWAEPILDNLSSAMEKAKGLSSESKKLVDEGNISLDKWNGKKLSSLLVYTKETEASLNRISDEVESLSSSVAVSGASDFDGEEKVVFTPVCRRLSKPEKFVVKSASPYSVMLMWSIAPIVRSKIPRMDKNVLFKVEQRREGDFAVVYEGVKPICVCDKLTPETKYEFRVCAKYTGCSDSQWSEYSHTVSVTTKVIPVPTNFVVSVTTKVSPVPTNFVLSEPRIATLRGSWNFIPLPHGKTALYQLGIRKAGKAEETAEGKEEEDDGIQVAYEGKENAYTFESIEVNTKYVVYLRSGCEGVWGSWDSGTEFTTSERFPGFWSTGPNYYVGPESGRVATTTVNGFYTTILGESCLEPNAVNDWSVRVINTFGSDLYIGLAPNTINRAEKHNEYKPGWYIYCNSGKVYSCGKKFSYGDGGIIRAGSTVSVHVDTKKGEVSFSVDEKRFGTAFTGLPLNTPLVPVVLAYNKGDSVEILPYKKDKVVKEEGQN